MSANLRPVPNEEEGGRRPTGGGRVPPNNLEAEESLLGAMLLSRDAIASAVELGLSGPDFYKPAHGHIFDAILALNVAGVDHIDPVTVADHLSRVELLDGVGGSAAMVALQLNTPAIGNAARYARIVKDHATLRRLISVAGEIAELAYDRPEDVAGAVDGAEALLFGLHGSDNATSATPIVEGVSRWMEAVEERHERGGLVEGTTGLLDLDEMTDGLRPSLLWTVAGRPGMGKSSLACAIAAHVGARAPVLVVSVEMSVEEWCGRLVATHARLVGSEVSRGRLSPRDWERISPAVSHVAGLSIDVYDASTANILSVRAQARRSMARFGRPLGLIVVDYLQLMQGRSAKPENRQVEVAEISRGLKVLARELACPVLALAQIGRQVDSRGDKRPTLADLRESGAPEQDSDVVALIYVAEKYDPHTDERGVAEINVAKHRNGPTGVVKVAVDLARGRWSDLAKGGL